MYAIGIDLGGTSVKYALISKEGRFIYEGTLPSYADISAEAVVSQLLKAIGEIKEYASVNNIPLKGIGIGTPGIIDDTNRVVIGGAENIVGWENIDLAGIIEKETSLPVVVSNDANVMGFAEATYGAAKDSTHVVFLTVGTGIGGAVIIDGKLFNGFANRGTELGHVPLIANGEKCACGSVGCLETYASTSALVRKFSTECHKAGRTFDGREINGKLIVELYKQGDELATEWLDEHCFYLERGIVGFINIFSPQKIVIGGGLSEAGGCYIQNVSQQAYRQVMADKGVSTRFMVAELGDKAGGLVAASLIFE